MEKIKLYGLVYHTQAIKKLLKKNKLFQKDDALIDKYFIPDNYTYVHEYEYNGSAKLKDNGKSFTVFCKSKPIGYVSKDFISKPGKYELYIYNGKQKIIAPNKEIISFGEDLEAYIYVEDD